MAKLQVVRENNTHVFLCEIPCRHWFMGEQNDIQLSWQIELRFFVKTIAYCCPIAPFQIYARKDSSEKGRDAVFCYFYSPLATASCLCSHAPEECFHALADTDAYPQIRLRQGHGGHDSPNSQWASSFTTTRYYDQQIHSSKALPLFHS